jgi:signal transduction histidine kinase/ActR/RegA family two-component response regulator
MLPFTQASPAYGVGDSPDSAAPPEMAATVKAAIDLCSVSPLPMAVWKFGGAEPIVNEACAALMQVQAGGARSDAWCGIEKDMQSVMQTGQALMREGASRLTEQGRAEGLGTYALQPLLERGRIAGVLLIGTRTDPRLLSIWPEHQLYTQVCDTMDLGFSLVEVIDVPEGQPPDHVFVKANSAYERQSGLSQIVGRRMSELVTQREAFWPEAFGRVLSSGETLRTTATMKRTDRTFETSIMRIGGRDSRQLAVLLKNITVQTHAERLLKRSEEQARLAAVQAQEESARLAAVLDASPAAVVVVDTSYRFVVVNSQARRTWGELLQPGSRGWVGHWADDSARCGQRVSLEQWPLYRALQGERPSELIEITSPIDGQTRRTFLCSAAPILRADASISGAVVVSVDITDRVEAERALRRAHAHKDEFLAMLGHELRNPLAPIAMAADLIARPSLDAQSLSQASGIIARQVRHMRGMLDDLLDAARVNEGLIRLDLRFHDLCDLIHDAVEQVQGLMQQMGHTFSLDLPPGPLFMDADGKRVVQVVANLLNNAAKYTPSGGRIELVVQAVGDELQVQVTDNGIGMNADTLGQAFDLFVQAERRSDRREGGLGLGLALVKKLVELHGGAITASSPGPGRGSRFAVQLPRRGPSALHDALDAAALMRRPSPALDILLVDDNLDAIKTLSMFLQARGHDCRLAHTAEQALALAAERAPQVFILDIGLPGMDGKELARRLRSAPDTAGAHILALSGYAQTHEKQAAIKAGVDHYLVKPVDVDRLVDLLAGVSADGGRQGQAKKMA